MELAIHDPKWVKPERYSLLERVFLPLMKDERDLIFVRVSAVMTAVLAPLTVLFFLSPPERIAWMAIPYLAFVFLAFAGRYGLMLHATGHRPIFKREYRWLQNYIPFVLGPYLGHTPTSFAAHHMWMHHAENNMLGDMSSTLGYKRDSFVHFMHYFLRFFLFGHLTLVRYLRLRGRTRTARRFVLGELSWFAVVGLLLWVNWAAALVMFVIPMLLMRFFLMAGNFAQHAFVDVSDPDNPYKNSNNLVNAAYNKIAYNDGYHIVHHLKPGMHWTEMPDHFTDNIDEYRRQDSVVFDGITDNIVMWVHLMTKNYNHLAKHLIDLRGRSHDERVAWLKTRTQTRLGGLPQMMFWETPEDVSRFDRKLGVSLEEALNEQ